MLNTKSMVRPFKVARTHKYTTGSLDGLSIQNIDTLCNQLRCRRVVIKNRNGELFDLEVAFLLPRGPRIAC